MTHIPDAGYDEPKEKSENEVAVFTVEPAMFHYSHSTAATVRRNGIAVGLLYLKSKEEFDWVKERLEGTFDMEDQS